MTPQEIFEQHVLAGMTANADAQAALYTTDGVYEAPLAPHDGPYPNRMEGHDELRAGFTKMHQRAQPSNGQVDPTRSKLVLHTTADPDVFIAELDAAFTNSSTVSLAQIYRLRDGKIASLRDYFSPTAL